MGPSFPVELSNFDYLSQTKPHALAVRCAWEAGGEN